MVAGGVVGTGVGGVVTGTVGDELLAAGVEEEWPACVVWVVLAPAEPVAVFDGGAVELVEPAVPEPAGAGPVVVVEELEPSAAITYQVFSNPCPLTCPGLVSPVKV